MLAKNADELTDEKFQHIYAWPQCPSLRLNLVLDSEGKIFGPDNNSSSLTNVLDRRLLKIIRKDADAVVCGAQSIRAEGWYLPPRGKLVVLSSTGDLPWETCPAPDRVIVVSSLPELRAWLMDHPGNNLCEGGLMTANLLLADPGFDEIALSFPGFEPHIVENIVKSNKLQVTLVSTVYSRVHDMSFSLWRRAA